MPPSWASEVAASSAEPCLVAGDGDALWLGSGAALYAAAPGAPVTRQSGGYHTGIRRQSGGHRAPIG